MELLAFAPRLCMSAARRRAQIANADVDAESFRDFAKVPPELVARSKEMDAFCKARFDKGQTWNAEGGLHLMSDEAARPYVTAASKLKVRPAYALARFGEEAIEYVLALHGGAQVIDLVECVEGAASVARSLEGDMRLARSRGARKRALAYLVLHPRLAAIVLVPMACSSKKRTRDAAGVALRAVADEHEALVRTTANEYGRAARDAIDAILDGAEPRPARRR